MSTRKASLSILAAAVLSACSSMPQQIDHAELEARVSSSLSQYQIEAPQAQAHANIWWQQIDNQELNQLLEEVLEQNQDLQASVARIRAAVAQLSDRQKANWPNGTLSVSANRDKGFNSVSGDITENLSTGATLNWQLDLSGRLSALADAAQAAAVNQSAQHQTLVTELVSSAINSYLYWQNLQQQHQLTERQLSALEASINILNARYAEGLSTELELNRTKAQYFELKQRLPQVAAERAKVEALLATLQNSQPSELKLSPLEGPEYQKLAFAIHIEKPIEALMTRGDMRAARANLMQQKHLTTSAERALYPDISFAAFAGVFNNTGINFNDTSSAWQVTPQVSWSLFSYPQLLAQLEQQQALSEASYFDYQSQLTKTIADSELSLQMLIQLERQVKLAQQRSEAATKAYQLADIGYVEGQLGYLELLNARQDVLIAEQAQLVVQHQWLEANVNVYHSFSGTWSRQLIDQASL